MLLHMDASFIASPLSLFSQEAIFVFVIQIIRTPLGEKKNWFKLRKKFHLNFL
jgi:hypothetical protein